MLDNNPLTGLIEPPDRRDSWRWGTIVSGSPVRVRLDGDSEASLATPDCLVSVTVGDRVRVQISNRRMTVFGKLYTGTQGNPGEIVINGTAYPTSGVVNIPKFTFTYTASPFWATVINMPVPFTPPSGWTFAFSTAKTTGYTLIHNSSEAIVNGAIQIRLIQFGSDSTAAATRAFWQLVKL